MSFKENMTRADYIYLDILYKIDEISDLAQEAKKAGAISPISVAGRKLSGGEITDPKLQEALAKKEAEIVRLINSAALTLGIKTEHEIKKMGDVSKVPELYNWVYLTNKNNNETLAAFNIKKALEEFGVKEEPSLEEAITLVYFGIEKQPWELVKKYSKGLLKNEEDMDFVRKMQRKDPIIANLITRVTKQNDCLVSINNSSEQYLGRKSNFKSLKETTSDILDWTKYRTTLPREYFENSLPGDIANTYETLQVLSAKNGLKRR